MALRIDGKAVAAKVKAKAAGLRLELHRTAKQPR